MPRASRYTLHVVLRLEPRMGDEIDALLHKDERRVDFIRSAISREIAIRRLAPKVARGRTTRPPA